MEESKYYNTDNYCIWVDIKGYEGLYKISSTGEIKSVDRYVKHGRHDNDNLKFIKGRILKQDENKKRFGYMQVNLWKNNKGKTFKVHRLVAEHFIPNPNNHPQVNHIDGDKTNNNISNLEWVTDKENKIHGWENNLYNSEHRKKKIICLENGIIYDSVKLASEEIPCDRRYLFKHLKGKVKSVKGLHYEYLNGREEV